MDEDGLAGLWGAGRVEHLPGRQAGDGKRGGDGVGDPGGDGSQERFGHGDIGGIGAIAGSGEAEDTVAHGKAGAGRRRLHHAGQFEAETGGEGGGHGVAEISLADLPVEAIDAGGVDPHHDEAGRGLGHGGGGQGGGVDAAELGEGDGLVGHVCSPWT